MKLEGGCYCGALRYKAEGDPIMQAECLCRECQYITGGGPNMFMLMPLAGFAYTKGEAKAFTRSDLEKPMTREFCPNCGTHMVTRAPTMPGTIVLKVGSLDDPSVFAPSVAIFAMDRQPFHALPEGMATFERLPGR